MKIVEVNEISPKLIRSLLAVWESSVKGTHLFLTDDEIQNIKTYIPTAIQHVQHLVLIANENNYPLGSWGLLIKHLRCYLYRMNAGVRD